MQWHTLRTFVAEGWREYSTWGGASLAVAIAALFSVEQIADWTSRLTAAGAFVASLALVLKRDKP